MPGALLPALFFAGICIVILLAPPLGIVLGILTPAPLILLYLQRGRAPGLAGMAAVLLAVGLVSGSRQALFFFAEYAVMALIMAETIRLGWPFDRSIFLSAVGSAGVVGAVLVIYFLREETSLIDFLQEQVKSNFQQAVDSYKAGGKNQAEIDALQGIVDQVARPLAASFPAFTFVGALLGAVLNYAVTRFLWLRTYGAAFWTEQSLSEWTLPDQFVWLFIAAAAMVLFAEGTPRDVGLNALICAVTVYCFQGLAVAAHFFVTRGTPVFFRVLFFFLVLSQPLLLGVIAGVGVFDMWADFRKIRPREEPPEQEEDDEDG